MAPHPNLFTMHWSTFVPNLVLLSKSAQFGQILGLNSSPTTVDVAQLDHAHAVIVRFSGVARSQYLSMR